MARRVYVIELAREAGKRRDPRIPWVYVGSSARSPEERLEQHRRKYKSAGIVHRHAVRLRPDLYDDLPSFRRSGESVAAEKARAQDLAGAGFVAHCDGVSYGEGSGRWREWDYDRLLEVAEHADAAITELVECTFRPPTVERCAELLWGAQEFWVRDLIDQEDPPPPYGIFSHVSPDALQNRIEALIEEGKLEVRSQRLYTPGA